MTYVTSQNKIRQFVFREKVVMESARTKLPSVVDFITGGNFKGGWWALPNSSAIYNTLTKLRDSPQILVCKLVRGKVTYVSHDILPYLICLSAELPADALARITEVHSGNGRHTLNTESLSSWASQVTMEHARSISRESAIDEIAKLAPHHRELMSELKIADHK
ncbi:hypothetical protein [Pseudomonas japonica]|uniref:hypothetical protein n=1 Tax=Pseudomonas japonica TaxID=256466 RepID=UPI001131308F|nr:hypothetical protein [Pseudomonas japonica]